MTHTARRWRYLAVAALLLSALAGLTACGKVSEYPGVPREGSQSGAVVQPAAASEGASASQEVTSGGETAESSEESSEGGAEQVRAELAQVDPASVPLVEKPEIELKDYEFVPKVVKVKAGEVEFAWDNTATHAHNYRIVKKGTEEVVFPGPKVGAMRRQRKILELEPGEYEVFCNLSDHLERGMIGLLFVEP